MATTYLNDVGDDWYQGWAKMRGECTWAEFAAEFCERFGERGMTDVVEEFNKIRQNGSVAEYQRRFEELKALNVDAQP